MEENDQLGSCPPASPPRHDKVIYIIYYGSKVSGIMHAAAKKSTRDAKNGKEPGM
uniref:Uncharacterized protein n=1 Tax=Brassica oleracea TaxID=3712 RepID=A0A3P6D0A4_BRAOL|nr:unnamed protein product [Brassica oleracea]